jgi:hypothetical protein
MLSSSKLSIVAPDCVTYPCHEECGGAGCDVWPHERAKLIESGLAHAADFDEAYQDEEGDWLHRTALGSRGCVFLRETRGCRLHETGLKPEVCAAVPRNAPEADEMAADGMLPCRSAWHL